MFSVLKWSNLWYDACMKMNASILYKSILSRFFYLLLTVCICLFLFGCRRAADFRPLKSTIVALDTVVTITLYDTDDRTVLDQAVSLCNDYEKLFSRTLPESDIYRINHSGGKTVKVDPQTIDLIKEALTYCEMTDGAVDITIAPVKELWDFSGSEDPHLPEEASLSEALSHVDYHCVTYDEEALTVTLTDPHAMIDLGFIAKGYIADRIKEYLISAGVNSAIIDLGGNVLTIGEKPDGSAFSIGIQTPFEDSIIKVLPTRDGSVVTAGIYERCFTIDGVLYHHILDTRTGYPVSNELLSVTILSDSSMEGDALSTACLILGSEKAQKLLEGMEDIDAILITEDYKIYNTRNL